MGGSIAGDGERTQEEKEGDPFHLRSIQLFSVALMLPPVSPSLHAQACHIQEAKSVLPQSLGFLLGLAG